MVLKGIYHAWKYCHFVSGGLSKWKLVARTNVEVNSLMPQREQASKGQACQRMLKEQCLRHALSKGRLNPGEDCQVLVGKIWHYLRQYDVVIVPMEPKMAGLVIGRGGCSVAGKAYFSIHWLPLFALLVRSAAWLSLLVYGVDLGYILHFTSDSKGSKH